MQYLNMEPLAEQQKEVCGGSAMPHEGKRLVNRASILAPEAA